MSKPKKILLSAKNVQKSYSIGGKSISILKKVSLDVSEGDHIAIMGASGSGKSTLLTLLAALEKPDEGSIFFKNENITKFSETALAELRRTDFGFVFQSFYLIPSLTALENVMFPLELLWKDSVKARKEALKLLERVNLLERVSSFPHQLSGGEMQRVAIARALIHQPKILFADEPTGNLDEKNSKQVLKLLLDLQKELGSALIIVTHELEISQLADRVLTLENGHLVTV